MATDRTAWYSDITRDKTRGMNSELPDYIDYIEQLKAMLRKQQNRLCQYSCQVAGYEQEIERLKVQPDRLCRMLFGQSSEKSAISWKIRSGRLKNDCWNWKTGCTQPEIFRKMYLQSQIHLMPVPRQNIRSPARLHPREMYHFCDDFYHGTCFLLLLFLTGVFFSYFCNCFI